MANLSPWLVPPKVSFVVPEEIILEIDKSSVSPSPAATPATTPHPTYDIPAVSPSPTYGAALASEVETHTPDIESGDTDRERLLHELHNILLDIDYAKDIPDFSDWSVEDLEHEIAVRNYQLLHIVYHREELFNSLEDIIRSFTTEEILERHHRAAEDFCRVENIRILYFSLEEHIANGLVVQPQEPSEDHSYMSCFLSCLVGGVIIFSVIGYLLVQDEI